jgi:phosphoadenosine phosphosulfate reductase
MNLEEKVEISKLIIQHALDRYPRIFAACSFGKDSRVLVDLAIQIRPDLLFIGIDTGYEFDETLEFADALVRETRINFRWVRPAEEARNRIEAEYGDSMIRNNRYKCCEMKLPAIQPVLAEFDGWITALRRDENEHRKNTRLIEDGKTAKVNPIAFWTREDVWNYIHGRRLSYHPLYDQGYPSLGCRPCTSTTALGEAVSERNGRFGGTTHQGQECGLHV